MKAQVKKWGNSLALRLPLSVLKDVRIADGAYVDMAVEGNKIIIKPFEEYSLDELLQNISDENLHPEIDNGGSVGAEQW